MHRIGVVAVGSVPEATLKAVAAHVSGYLNLHTEVLPSVGLPSHALDPRRLQYDAGVVLNWLEAVPFSGIDKVVGVVSVDLFVPIFTHVFGEARQGGSAALVSLFQLGSPSLEAPRVMERTAKVALHELCHLFSLAHCQDIRCLMHFSGGLEALDRTPLYFCRYCALFFRDAIRASSSREIL